MAQPHEKTKRWVNFYEGDGCSQYPFKTRKEADEFAHHHNRIACVMIEFERGDGLVHGRLIR